MIAAREKPVARQTPLVAIAGNPNSGKTTLFNRLTGSRQRVGNYPGVTVDRHVGRLVLPGGKRIEMMDVPGTYSLSARSREEQLAIQAVAGIPPLERPDLVVVVVDATQLLRNLYLVLQVIELDVPVVLALNMADVLEKERREVDTAALERELGVPVVLVSALKGRGLERLREAIASVLGDSGRGRPGWRWTPSEPRLLEDLEQVAAALPRAWTSSAGANGAPRIRALALWALLSLGEDDELEEVPAEVRERVLERRRLARAGDREIDEEVIAGRYAWIDARADRFVRDAVSHRPSTTERVDAVLLNPAAGFAIFLALMTLVFQALFSWADPVIGWIDWLFGRLGTAFGELVPAGILRDLVVGGVFGGVGSVVAFLPQILLLFLFIGIMEGTGYMARVAFLMDRLMKAIGLHGRAFVPMLSGYACAIPAILATRTMERRRDRMLTMMVVPLMTCSARLPIYALIIGALFPPTRVLGALPVQGLLMAAMYLFSTLTALAAAAVLGRTIFKGPRVPLILELPPYRVPHWPSILRLAAQKARAFLGGAGGVILACSIALVFLLSFPKSSETTQRFAAERTAALEQVSEESARSDRLAAIDAAESSEHVRHSLAGRLGHGIEPLLEPLGFDWKIGIGLIGAFAAREVFVSTMGVVYGVAGDPDDEAVTLRERIRNETRADGRPVYTPLVGLSLMVFFALACQCMSTLAVVYRETRSWRWPVFLFLYMTALAWIASFVVYQGGRLLGFG